MAATSATPRVLHLSLLVGGDLVGRAGGRLGRIEDFVVRLDAEYPSVTGALARVAGREARRHCRRLTDEYAGVPALPLAALR